MPREQASLFAKCCSDLVRDLFPGGWERGRGIVGRYDSRKGLGLHSETDLDASTGSTTYLGRHFISLGLSSFICQVALLCLPHGSPRAHSLQITHPCPGIAAGTGWLAVRRNTYALPARGRQPGSVRKWLTAAALGAEQRGLHASYELCDLSRVTVSLSSGSSSDTGNHVPRRFACELNEVTLGEDSAVT